MRGAAEPSSVSSTLQPLAAEKGLEFATRVPDDLPLAHGDAGLALTDALGPATATDPGERRRRERRALQAAVQPVGLLPREEHLGC